MKKRNDLPEKLKDLLFEIGTEELPATNLADIFESLEENIFSVKFRKAFEEKRIGIRSCKVLATPRRLVFHAEGIETAQRPQDEKIKILAKQEAYTDNGQPTEKLLMILKHRNFPLKETVISDLNGREYVFIKKSEAVQKTASLLPEILTTLVKSLPFQKNMKWDDSGVYFPRPIRNYLCLYGDRVISFKIGHTRVKNETIIFSKSKRTAYSVKDIPAYFGLLKKNGVILDPAERKKAIQDVLFKLIGTLPGRLYDDPFLLNEVNFLVEDPQGVTAPFEEAFLKLPLEVLTVSMARKQRIFGLVDKNNKVLPRFLAILDGKTGEKEKKVISHNIENILHAKLQDSLFFYNEDIKISLEKKREELKNLIFLKDAGSMFEKSNRLINLAKQLAKEIQLSGGDQGFLERACFLSKSDLLTQMVGEFPELQGIMGKYYALENGEPHEVAFAIGEQYLPRTVQDRLPETIIGAYLSIFDKMDLIVTCFGLGLDPSSSLDPYGLRRSAAGIFKIILEHKLNVSFYKFFIQADRFAHDAISNACPKKNPSHDDREKKLEAFFKDRFKGVLTDKGFREDLVDASMASDFRIPYETFLRVEALSYLVDDPHFAEAWKVVERTSNILKGNKEALPDEPKDELLQEDLERQVFESYGKSHAAIRQAANSRDFKLATSLYAEAFFDILNKFFEKVFVNAEDLVIRKNRLALLRDVNRLYTANIADLSKIRLISKGQN